MDIQLMTQLAGVARIASNFAVWYDRTRPAPERRDALRQAFVGIATQYPDDAWPTWMRSVWARKMVAAQLHEEAARLYDEAGSMPRSLPVGSSWLAQLVRSRIEHQARVAREEAALERMRARHALAIARIHAPRTP